ncbi:hypothetical protein [uncultured Ruminococcus sp.]|uniref:hypothetical protein n=1 Tax=uncultured Ruminococcus sp. TaxID=165186 RepID=UPI0025F04992|nr:hypothetical protein [uncultured Ruminococcus sp.]
MKNLTELLKDIPLEEMTGGLDMSTIAENKTETNVKNSKAKIKNKVSAAAAIAACAVVAVAGAIHYRGNDIQKHGASNDSAVTTDAQDSANEEPVHEDSPEKELNYELAKLFFDDMEMDMTQMGDNLRIMSTKVGDVTEGFENYDFWIPGVLVEGTKYNILVALQTKDGSNLPKDLEYIDFKGDYNIDGYHVSGGSEGTSMHIFGDKAVGMFTFDLDATVCAADEGFNPYEDYPEASEVLNADSKVHYEIRYLFMDDYDEPLEGLFTAELKLGDVFGSQPVNEEKQSNEANAKLFYDIHGYDYELAKKNVYPLDSKVGEIKEGFEGLDISLCDVRMCSSTNSSVFDIVIKNKDGSDFAEGISDPNNILNGSSLEMFVGDESVKLDTSHIVSVSKDTAIYTIYVDWTSFDEDAVDEDSNIIIKLSDLSSTKDDNTEIKYDGLFEAILNPETFEELDIGFPELGGMPDEPISGLWDINENLGAKEPQYLKYNVGEVCFSNCEIMVELFGGEDLDKFLDELHTAWSLQATMIDRRKRNVDTSEELMSDRDLDFIKLEYEDGTIEIPNYRNVDFMRTEGSDKNGKTIEGYIMDFDCLDAPFDARKVKAIHIGSAVIPVK